MAADDQARDMTENGHAQLGRVKCSPPAQWTPKSRGLQVYLRFHRFIGFIQCLLLAVSVYSTGK